MVFLIQVLFSHILHLGGLRFLLEDSALKVKVRNSAPAFAVAGINFERGRRVVLYHTDVQITVLPCFALVGVAIFMVRTVQTNVAERFVEGCLKNNLCRLLLPLVEGRGRRITWGSSTFLSRSSVVSGVCNVSVNRFVLGYFFFLGWTDEDNPGKKTHLSARLTLSSAMRAFACKPLGPSQRAL